MPVATARVLRDEFREGRPVEEVDSIVDQAGLGQRQVKFGALGHNAPARIGQILQARRDEIPSKKPKHVGPLELRNFYHAVMRRFPVTRRECRTSGIGCARSRS